VAPHPLKAPAHYFLMQNVQTKRLLLSS
jgi:hypothetical protein